MNGGNDLVLKCLRVSVSEGMSWRVCEKTYNLLSDVSQEYVFLECSAGHGLEVLIGPEHPL
jgi:hypothetical protein